jgi:hypothetical protein
MGVAMRRSRASKRGRWFSILLAGFVGLLLGDRLATTSRRIDISPSENVALRFPEANAEAAVAAPALPPPASNETNALVLGNTQLALLSPMPMVPQRPKQPAPPAMPPAAGQAAAPPETTASVPAATTAALRPAPAATPPRAEPKLADAAARHANRQGYMLNDAQIASIKARLHLTPDQEPMWPAVEAALRNVAYAKAREAHRHGTSANAAQLAAAAPDSVEVQGLKSAAMPLLMSFTDQQKNEVRSLAHVMGLDKLANEL